MEDSTPFELNRAVQHWRESLAESPAFRGDNLDELESHLRDSIAALERQGLSSEEAFLVAAKRVGTSTDLSVEFSAVNRKAIWLDRVLWMLIGIQVWSLASGLIGSIARNAFAVGWRTFGYNAEAGGMTLPVTLFALVQVLAFAVSIGFCWWLIGQKGATLAARLAPWLQRRSTFTVCCIALCLLALFANIFSSSLSAILFWRQGPEVVGQAMLYSSYSKLWVTPFQIAAMIAATLVLARKRLGFSRRSRASL